MTLSERLTELVRACFTGIWIDSHEHQDALAEITRLCQQEDWQLATWDLEQGLQSGSSRGGPAAQNPLAAVRSLGAVNPGDGAQLLVLQNFHRFLQSAEIVQALLAQLGTGKQARTFVIILSPIVSIPVELEKLFVVVEHQLPDRQQLQEIAGAIASEEGELPGGRQLELLLDAATGLTRHEAEAAFSLSLVRNGRLAPDAVWELKTQTLKKSGLLTLYRGDADFSGLGGMAALKAFTRRALLQPCRSNPLKRARGVLLLSPPGCGKSQFCKSLGKEVGRPVLVLDVGSLMGSLLGQSEERTRQALRTIDALAPCVAMLDEVEKAFAGLQGSGDSGVASRMFGRFLTWLNDHESDVFTVCTANDVSRLPPEFARAERFDGVFFLDLPGREEKDAIWGIYLKEFQLSADQPLPDDSQWSGAEIRACCRLAALLDLPLAQAAENVVPVAVTSAESVQQLRAWASGRCLSASSPGIYRQADSSGGRRRRIPRDPSAN